MNLKTTINIIGWIGIVLGIFFIILITFWITYDYNPLVINSVKILDNEVRVGEYIKYEVSYCKYTNKPAEISRSFIDGVLFSTPTNIVNSPEGCGINIICLGIPKLPEGEYYLKLRYNYNVNPIRNVLIEYDTETFRIIE